MPSRTPSSSRPRRAMNPPQPDSSASHTCQPGGPCTDSSHGQMHAARGVVSVWLAALMAVLSFAALATLASDVYAQSSTNSSNNTLVLLRQMNGRLERMETLLKKMNGSCELFSVCAPKAERSTTTTSTIPDKAACEERCALANELCVRNAGDKQDLRTVCVSKAEACRATCSTK